jgi:CMP-N,N'-diacetyllegionaminic acid synthase
VIPARIGSKRVPRKNLRMLCGNLTQWVVSTESHEIAQVANAYGAFVVKRPQELAEDDTTSGAVLRHALDWMEDSNGVYDVVVCLHPTSPIRDPDHIDQAIEALWDSPCDTLASVCMLPEKSHPNIMNWGGFYYGDSEGAIGILNASIYAMKRNWFIKNNTHVGGYTRFMDMDRRHSLDIDEEIDLKIAELFLQERG